MYFVTAIVGIPVAIASFLLMLSMVDFSGANNPGPAPFLLIMFAAPAGVAALLTALFHSYAQKESGGRMHSGPMAVGVAAGAFAGGALSNAGLPYPFWTSFVIIPLAGALAGSYFPMPLTRPAAGAIAGALGVVTALMQFDF